jgi:hypothetical protein
MIAVRIIRITLSHDGMSFLPAGINSPFRVIEVGAPVLVQYYCNEVTIDKQVSVSPAKTES